MGSFTASLIVDMFMQSHIRVLESSPENISALVWGLEYLINISYVDDTEVFKVYLLLVLTKLLLEFDCLRRIIFWIILLLSQTL